MQRRHLETTLRKSQKNSAQPIRQTSSGHKNLKLTSKGENSKPSPISKDKNNPPLKVSHSPKNPKSASKQLPVTPNPNKTQIRQTSSKKQKNRKKIVSYISHESDLNSDLKTSVVQIDLPNLDDAIDDNINMLSISNYPIKDNSKFLRETHMTLGKLKRQYMKADIKKNDELKKSSVKIRKTSSKKLRESQSQQSKMKTTSEKKLLLGSNRKQEISKSHKKLQTSNNGLKISTKPLQKSTKGAFSKTKKGKKEKSSSTETNKGYSSKKVLKTVKNGKSQKTLVPEEGLKSKPWKSKKKKSPERKNLHIPNSIKPSQEEESSSDTTKTPTLQELQTLREQNEKYKVFLATSAFKVEELKKQIEHHKQIRQNQRGIYNFQLNNLKKQLEANKKCLGHLYSYDEPPNIPGFIPDQIIVETDNESSSVLESMNLISNVSKHLTHEDAFSDGSSNKIRKSNQSVINVGRSNPSSNSNEEDEKLTRTQLTAMLREMKEDLMKEEAQLKFLSEIEKIPSLEVKLSLEESGSSKEGREKEYGLDLSSRGLRLRGKKESGSSYEDGENGLLLLNSVGK